MSNGEEQLIGAVLYAAISPDYTTRAILFTDRRVLEIPLSRVGELVNRVSQLPTTAAWLLEAANPATFSGLGGLIGLKMWSNLKKNVADKRVVVLDKESLPSQVVTLAVSEIPYEKIKKVKIKKVAMSTDWYMHLDAGFIKSQNCLGVTKDVYKSYEPWTKTHGLAGI